MKATLHSSLCLLLAILPISLAAAERVNPFASPLEQNTVSHAGTHQAAPIEFTLKAVMPSPTHPLANISGKLVTVNDTYFGYQVTAIDSRGVTLQRGQEIVSLPLRPDQRTEQ